MNKKQKIMKYLKVYIVFVLGVLLASCSADDKAVDDLEADTIRGAVLRTISNDPNSFAFDDPDSEWTITIEEQDIEDGDLLQSVDVLLDFVDLTGNGVSATETLLMNIPASDFVYDANGLPRYTFTITYQEALDLLGLPFTTAYAGDSINIRMILYLTDGRTITNTDIAGTLLGSFFASPFNYRSNIVCPPKAGTIGTWTVDMQDSFGDGWNGATLDIIIDGETAESFFVTEDEGTVGTRNFDITADNETLSIQYRAGDFDSENTFQVTNPNSIVIIDAGPSPPVDTEFLDYCSDF